MEIRAVKMGGWKGQTGERVLGRLNLLTGPNGSGKTGLMEAVRWTITGTTCLGKKPESAIAYGDGTGCSASVCIGDVEYARELKQDNRTGSVKQFISVSGNPGIGIREADALIKQECGDFLPMWDLGEFMIMSPDKRRDFILDLCAKACGRKVDVDSIMDRIWKVSVADLLDAANSETLTEDQTSPLDRQLKDLRESISADIKNDLTVAIGGALVRARDMTNRAKAMADGATEASRRLRDRLAQIHVAAESVADLRDMVEAHRQRAADLSAEIVAAQTREPMRRSAEAALAKATEALQKVMETLDAYKDDSPEDRMATALALEEESQEIAALMNSAAPVKDDALAKRKAELEAALSKTRADHEALATAIGDIRLEVGTTEYKLEVLGKSPWKTALDLVTDIIDADLEMDEHISDVLIELLEICQTNAKTEEVKALRDKLAAAQNELQGKEQECEIVCKLLDGLEKDVKKVDRQWLGLLDRQRIAAGELLDLERQSKQKLSDATAIRNELADRDKKISSLVDQQRSLTAQCDELKQQINDLSSPVDVGSLRSLVAAAQREAKDCQEAIEAKQRFAALDAELQCVVASSERERIAYDSGRSVVKAVKGVREELMADLVAPLIEHVNHFFSEDGRTAYCRLENARGAPVLEFGLSDGEREVSLEHMSGGESVLFGAALSFAMVRMADVPLKVLLIEAAEVDDDVFSQLLNALEAVAGGLSNVFVATCGHAYASDAWNTISLRKEKPVQELGV